MSAYELWVNANDAVERNTRKLKDLEEEYERRKNVLLTTSNSKKALDKLTTKGNLIDTKIQSKLDAVERSLEYHRKMMTNAETSYSNSVRDITSRYESAIDRLNQEYNTKKEAIEARFRNSKQEEDSKIQTARERIGADIRSCESNKEKLVEPLEKQKEILMKQLQVDEDADPILVNIKEKKKQVALQLEEDQARAARHLAASQKDQRNIALERAREEAMKERQRQLDEQHKQAEETRLYKQPFQEEKKEESVVSETDSEEEETETERLREQERKQRKAAHTQKVKTFKNSILPTLSQEYQQLFKDCNDYAGYYHKQLLAVQERNQAIEMLQEFEDDVKHIKEFEEKVFETLSDDKQYQYREFDDTEEKGLKGLLKFIRSYKGKPIVKKSQAASQKKNPTVVPRSSLPSVFH